MIDKVILKKHNLKAVPFSCIGEGQSFILEKSLGFQTTCCGEPAFFARKIVKGLVFFVGGPASWVVGRKTDYRPSLTVYVPVWRVTERAV